MHFDKRCGGGVSRQRHLQLYNILGAARCCPKKFLTVAYGATVRNCEKLNPFPKTLVEFAENVVLEKNIAVKNVFF